MQRTAVAAGRVWSSWTVHQAQIGYLLIRDG